MKSPRLYGFAGILLLFFTVFFLTRTTPPKTNDDSDSLKLINKTHLEILKTKRENDRVTFTLKNNYAQRITAYVISIGDDFRITEDFVVSESSDEFGIKSLDSYERTYSIPSSPNNNRVVHITLQAVVLDNKTGDGDPISFERVRDDRLGQAIQVRRSLKVIDKYIHQENLDSKKLRHELELALNASEADTLTELRELRSVGSTNKNGGPISDDVNRGLQTLKADTQRRVDEIDKSSSKKESLLKMKAYYEILLSRL